MKKTHVLTFIVALAMLAGAGSADAQYRGERWEFALGLNYQLSTDIDFETGLLSTDNDFGFVGDFGYNFNEKLAVSFGFQYGGIGYDAVALDDEGNQVGLSGTYDQWVMASNLIYHFSDGPITPYIGAGIGYTWVDTNVPTGPSQGVCWWDPWWGWVCYSTYPTKTEGAFSYQALIGFRYEFNDVTFMKLSYTSQWMDFKNSDGTPRFDVIGAEIGWMF